jgi:hypothetical protein
MLGYKWFRPIPRVPELQWQAIFNHSSSRLSINKIAGRGTFVRNILRNSSLRHFALLLERPFISAIWDFIWIWSFEFRIFLKPGG